MMAQIKANHVPETVWNFGDDSNIVPVFIVMNVGGCFLFQDPVYIVRIVYSGFLAILIEIQPSNWAVVLC